MLTNFRQQKKLETMMKDLALSQKERIVFLKLIGLGPSTGAEVARNCRNITRTSVYDVLKSLESQGLLSSFVESDRKYFQVGDVEYVIDKLEIEKRELTDKQDKIREVSDFLKQIKSGSAYIPTVRFFEGEDGILAIHRELLNARKETRAIGNIAAVARVFPRIFFEDNLQEFRIYKVPMLSLLIKNREAERYIKIAAYKEREFKWLPENIKINTDTFIWDGHIAILDYSENLSGVIIDNPTIFETFVVWFDIIWGPIDRVITT